MQLGRALRARFRSGIGWALVATRRPRLARERLAPDEGSGRRVTERDGWMARGSGPAPAAVRVPLSRAGRPFRSAVRAASPRAREVRS